MKTGGVKQNDFNKVAMKKKGATKRDKSGDP